MTSHDTCSENAPLIYVLPLMAQRPLLVAFQGRTHHCKTSVNDSARHNWPPTRSYLRGNS